MDPPETVICACPSSPVHGGNPRCNTAGRALAAGGTGILGGYWEGYTGYGGVLPTHRARRSYTSEAGPVGPAGPGVGGCRAGCVSLGPSATPPLPAVGPAPLGGSSSKPRLLAYSGEN